jgi:hypothetical protein
VILLLVMILTPEASSSPLSVSAVAKTMSHAAVDVDCAAEEGGYRSVVLPEFAILDEIVRFSGSYHDREEEATCKVSVS